MDNGFLSPVDPSLELSDPNPNIHELFHDFDQQFFWGRLAAVEVKWSPRMTLCAGICRYQTRSGFCTIGLSKPLLSLRPRRDLVETLLHEMIHAYLFVTHNNRDRDGHGPEFHKHMNRINNQIGSKISVYHKFHDEVRAQKVHVWKCQGPCQNRPPFYGYVRRSMNRAPGPHDLWHAEHKASCGGAFVKILEPPDYKKKGRKPSSEEDKKSGVLKKKDPTKGPNKGLVDPARGTPKITTMFSKSPPNSSPFADFKPFSGTGHRLGSSSSQTSSQNRPPTQTRVGPTQTLLNVTLINSSQSSASSQGSIVSIPASGKRKKPTPRKKKQIDVTPVPSGSQITRFFVKKSPISDDDTDLLLLPPPSKRIKSDPGLEVKLPNRALPSSSSSSSSSANKENEGPCPVCGKKALLSTHLPLCLASIPCDDEGDLTILAVVPPPEASPLVMSPPEVFTVACPVCGVAVQEIEINTHLDSCVST